MPQQKRVIILGAAGRDFHNFNTAFRGNKNYRVVAFTAAQIPDIEKRKYPKSLAGYDIPIYSEALLPQLIKKLKADEVVLSYSDLPHQEVMHKASLAVSCRADFRLLGFETMLKSRKPVIAVTATRTGAGKSPLSRKIIKIVRGFDPKKKIAVIRHPMPYGELSKKFAIQRFASFRDLKPCTFEEIEEYEPHIESGSVVYAGIDYEKILRRAEKEADIILWDGGNNDFPFIKPGLWICVADARRPGHELGYYPGEVNARSADIVVINKASLAPRKNSEIIFRNIKSVNSNAKILKSDLKVFCKENPSLRGKKVLAIEDGPTITHGGLADGAAAFFCRKAGAKLLDPRKWAVGSIAKVYKKYPHIGAVLPCLGYSEKQISELQKTISAVPCDAVVCGTPLDIRRFLKISKPVYRITYEIEFLGNGEKKLAGDIRKFLCRKNS